MKKDIKRFSLHEQLGGYSDTWDDAEERSYEEPQRGNGDDGVHDELSMILSPVREKLRNKSLQELKLLEQTLHKSLSQGKHEQLYFFVIDVIASIIIEKEKDNSNDEKWKNLKYDDEENRITDVKFDNAGTGEESNNELQESIQKIKDNFKRFL